jgi:hypothetical protein
MEEIKVIRRKFWEKERSIFSLIFKFYQEEAVKNNGKVIYGLKDGNKLLAKEIKGITSFYTIFYKFLGEGFYYSDQKPTGIMVPIFRKRNKFELFFLKLINKLGLKKRILKSKLKNILDHNKNDSKKGKDFYMDKWEKGIDLVQNLSEESCLEFIEEYEINQSKEKREFSNYGNKPITDLERKGSF